MPTIRPASFPADLGVVAALFREYADSLPFDLDFQDFENELASLPGKYAVPAGRVLLALDDCERVLGCVALRPIDADSAEMKRLYVRPTGRGLGAGRLLAEAVCDAAREAGYARICLDTLTSMRAAVALYTSLGFRTTDPYVFNPLADAQFFALDLLATVSAPGRRPRARSPRS
ncbi:MAG: GNAT family N-acetyltransferase [Burkholderiaceae bacterium]